ncbi:MAG: dienelactone hydrolase family protein [Pseudomonadota bacterium]
MSERADDILGGHRVAPTAGGPAKALVVLLHGYGADGQDLIGLAQPLGQVLPNAAFRAPDAPEPCRVNPMGRQWFPIPWIDGASEQAMATSFEKSLGILYRYLDAAMAEEGLSASETALVGFSQGTMMSLYAGPRREGGVAGIVGFSGRLLGGETLAAEAKAKPPVLLVHGDRDDVLPVACLDEARAGLAAAGFEVSAHVSPGTPHGIAPDGLGLARGFLTRYLPSAVAATG